MVLDRFVADGRFTTGSIVGGWAVMDYLKKYGIRFFGPYLDAQVGLGYASAALRPMGDGADDAPFTASGLTFTTNGDLGLAAYRRVRSLRGAGGFLRVGVRGWLQLTGNSEPDPAEADDRAPAPAPRSRRCSRTSSGSIGAPGPTRTSERCCRRASSMGARPAGACRGSPVDG